MEVEINEEKIFELYEDFERECLINFTKDSVTTCWIDKRRHRIIDEQIVAQDGTENLHIMIGNEGINENGRIAEICQTFILTKAGVATIPDEVRDLWLKGSDGDTDSIDNFFKELKFGPSQRSRAEILNKLLVDEKERITKIWDSSSLERMFGIHTSRDKVYKELEDKIFEGSRAATKYMKMVEEDAELRRQERIRNEELRAIAEAKRLESADDWLNDEEVDELPLEELEPLEDSDDKASSAATVAASFIAAVAVGIMAQKNIEEQRLHIDVAQSINSELNRVEV